MILSAQSIRERNIISPFNERSESSGLTYGLSPAGYDVRLNEELLMQSGKFKLFSTMEHFSMPNDVMGIVHDKSTLARRGLAVQNTVIEPGWSGYLTLEITNHGGNFVMLQPGSGVAQVVFHLLDRPSDAPYDGKYQNQESGPQEAR